ncbi:Uncharacterised protein [Mycobacteroides abscessus subsp. abscessus]|nr:Uncharacterised protein [Mycobacteroides abscessus subsp. abscessus]
MPRRAISSSILSTNVWISSAIALITLGANAFDASLRNRVWSGASSPRKEGLAIRLGFCASCRWTMLDLRRSDDACGWRSTALQSAKVASTLTSMPGGCAGPDCVCSTSWPYTGYGFARLAGSST